MARITDEKLLTNWELINIPISIIGLIGVVAFAFKKVIFKPRFWKVWFIVFTLWGILFSIFSSYDFFECGIGVVITGSLICLPGYLALFLYGYRSKEIWNIGINDTK